MAKQIIIKDQQNDPSGAATLVTVVFWYPINQNKRTLVNGSVWSGASQTENTAIQNGDVIEEVQQLSVNNFESLGTFKDTLSSMWVARNAQIAGVGPGKWININFDSQTFWSA